MNEKSNPMPMMYKTIPAVAELNKVPGFDPLKFLRHKVRVGLKKAAVLAFLLSIS